MKSLATHDGEGLIGADERHLCPAINEWAGQ